MLCNEKKKKASNIIKSQKTNNKQPFLSISLFIFLREDEIMLMNLECFGEASLLMKGKISQIKSRFQVLAFFSSGLLRP